MKAFRGLGFNLYEGYGMTESSPVLTVTRPGDKVDPRLGRPRRCPASTCEIDKPDANGVGEVIAKGPNVMAGYFENAEATAQTIIDGWLHTGDLGRIDEEGNLFIVGRKKEMILGAERREHLSRRARGAVRRLASTSRRVSVVGLPGEAGHETVAALIVPDYEDDGPIARGTCARPCASTSRRSARACRSTSALKVVPPVGPRPAEDRRRARSSGAT